MASTFTYFGGDIAEGSDGTPGLWNRRFSTLSQNLDQLNVDASAATGAVSSIAGTASQIVASSATGNVTLSLDTALQLPGSLYAPSAASFNSTFSVAGAAKFLSTLSSDDTIRATNLHAGNIVGTLLTAEQAAVHHGGLAGLGDDDHTQYVHNLTARTVSAVHTFNPTVAGAPFTLGANATGQLVTGLNADQLDGEHAAAFADAVHTHLKADITDTPWAWADVSKTGSSLADLATRAFTDLTFSGLAAGQLLQATAATTVGFATTLTGNYTWSGTQAFNAAVTITKTTTPLFVRYSATEHLGIAPDGTGTIAFAITTAGTKAYTFDGSLLAGSTTPRIYATADTVSLSITGGSAFNSGGRLLLYGGTHATAAGDIYLLSLSSTGVMAYDQSTNIWYFGAYAGTIPVVMGALTATSITASGLLQVTLTTEQARLRYSATEYQSITVGATGTTAFAKVTAGTKLYTFDAAITSAGLITANAGLTVATGQTLTVTGATVTGAPTWGSSQAITLSTAAQPNVTSLGTLTILNVDNIRIDGNTISSTAGTNLNITPLAGQQIVLDGAIVIDAGVVTGATSITSTTFVGALTGNVTGNVSGSSGSTTGNAATATALATARTINGVSFDGTANITVTAAAGTLTGATLAATVTASSLTSVGTLTSLGVAGTVTVTTAKMTLAAAVVGYASLNLPHGTAPTTPANGDVWTTTGGMYVRVNGATVGPLIDATTGDITGVTAGAGLTGGGTSGAVTLDVVGTANRITVAADSIDIASTYVGQTSITTLGTIATGTWNATAVAIAKVASGTARQLVQTNAGGTAAEWTSNVDIPGTLDVTGAVVFDSTLTAAGTSYLAPFYMPAAVGDKISLFDNRLGGVTMYGFGIDTAGGYGFSRAVTGWRWYIGVVADNGVSDVMELVAAGLTVNGALTATSVTAAGLLQVTRTSEQARLRYSATEYQSVTVGATGTTAFAKATAGTKLYTFDAKISTTGEIEVDGDFNHDGTNFGALGATPAPQRAHQADATDLASAIAAVNYALATLETFGYHAAV